MTGDCASCGHSAAYHDGDGGRVCRAWAPNDAATTDACPCKGWEQSKPKQLSILEQPAVDVDDFDWVG